MINLSRFIHENIDGKKYIFNTDLLELNVDNKEYNNLKKFLKRNGINVVITEKERKYNVLKNYTQSETEELFNELKKANEKDKKIIRGKIISGNTHIVNYILFKNYINYKIDYEDYSSYLYEVLIECVDNYLISGEKSFCDYTTRNINNKVSCLIRKDTGMECSTYSKYLLLKEEIEKDINKKISINDSDLFKYILDTMLDKSYISKTEYKRVLKKDEEHVIEEDVFYPFEEKVKKLDSILSNIKVKYENIIRLNYGIGERKYTLQQIGDKLGCSRANIGQLLKAGIESLKEYIENNYSKSEAAGLIQLIRNTNTVTETCIMDYPYNEENITNIFKKYTRCEEISRYDLRLFDINKKYIIEQALTGNDKAMYLCLRTDILLRDQVKWISINVGKNYYYSNYKVDGFNMFKFNTYILENDEYTKTLNSIFLTLKFRKLNAKQNKWIKENKQLLLKNATSGDSKAMYICLRTKDEETSTMYISPIEAINYYSYNTYVDDKRLFDNLKSGLTIPMEIGLVFDYFKENGHFPNMYEQKNAFGAALSIENNKEYIKSMALKGNDKAMFLCLRLTENNKPWITREEAKKVFPEQYTIDDINMYKNDICSRSITNTINIIFNTLKSYGGLTRKSNVVLINKYKIKLDEWIATNKELLLKEIFDMNGKAVYIVLHSNSTHILSIKELLKHYPIDYTIDGVMLYSGTEFYGKDSINILYNYLVRYNTFKQDQSIKNVIDVKKIFIQNKEVIYNEVKRNNSKAKLVYAEALKLYDDRVEIDSCDKDIIKIIHQVYEDYMVKGIYPNKNKSEYGKWLIKHQKDLIMEARNKNLEANEILRFYKDSYIDISSFNTQALSLCLENNWVLRKEVRCNANYYRLKKYEEKIKRLGK